jgi:tetratricopeptide (TPR) repeat protein
MSQRNFQKPEDIRRFKQFWDQAKSSEEEGHKFFQIAKYQMAAENHNKAAELFKKALEFVDPNDGEIRKRAEGNYHIELANAYQSLATYHFYRGEKEIALTNFQGAIQEQKLVIQEYETTKDKKKFENELILLKIGLYFYSAYENICLAQIEFFKEQYQKAIEYFKVADIHTNLELDFVTQTQDFERSKRTQARFYYIRGQVSRCGALMAIQEGKRKEAKEKYLEASRQFEEASKLHPAWNEYKELSEKSKRMARAIKE